MEYVIYIILYGLLCNWFQIYSFSTVFLGRKIKISELTDVWIQKTVKKKTGISLLSISLFHDSKLYGMMPGFPFWPKMILSEGLYNTLNRNELEWVILHEAAHCVFWHNSIAALLEIGISVVGILGIYYLHPPLYCILIFSILTSIFCIQSIRWIVEYSADSFSISLVDHPKAVITAQEKFRRAYATNMFNSETSIFRKLFHWNIPASKRIEMAKKRIFDK